MERLVEFLKRSEARSPPCAWLISWSSEEILRQARESTERYAGRMARPLEGVPFAVKDVADALPYPTTAGTSFMAGRCAPSFRYSTNTVETVLACFPLLAILPSVHH